MAAKAQVTLKSVFIYLFIYYENRTYSTWKKFTSTISVSDSEGQNAISLCTAVG